MRRLRKIGKIGLEAWHSISVTFNDLLPICKSFLRLLPWFFFQVVFQCCKMVCDCLLVHCKFWGPSPQLHVLPVTNCGPLATSFLRPCRCLVRCRLFLLRCLNLSVDRDVDLWWRLGANSFSTLLFSFVYPPSPTLPLPLEVGPLKCSQELQRVSSTSRGALHVPQMETGAEPQPKSNFYIFIQKIWHVVAMILMIFLIINWRNLGQFKQ